MNPTHEPANAAGIQVLPHADGTASVRVPLANSDGDRDGEAANFLCAETLDAQVLAAHIDAFALRSTRQPVSGGAPRPQIAPADWTLDAGRIVASEAALALVREYRAVKRRVMAAELAMAGAFVLQAFHERPWLGAFDITLSFSAEYDDEGGTYMSATLRIENCTMRAATGPDALEQRHGWDNALREALGGDAAAELDGGSLIDLMAEDLESELDSDAECFATGFLAHPGHEGADVTIRCERERVAVMLELLDGRESAASGLQAAAALWGNQPPRSDDRTPDVTQVLQEVMGTGKSPPPPVQGMPLPGTCALAAPR